MQDELYPDIQPHLQNVLEPGCARCPTLPQARTRISWGYGPIPAPILFVAEAPARGNEHDLPWQGSNHTGVPLTNKRSGRKVRSLVHAAGYDLSTDFYTTNIVKCFPPRPDDPQKNRQPNPEELAACWTHFQRELEQVQPKLIVCIGGVPWKQLHLQLLGLRNPPPFRQAVLEPPVQGPGVKIAPMLHPARIGFHLSKLGLTEADYVERLKALLAGAG